MSDQDKIDAYANALSRALRGVFAEDRESIVAEIAAHLEYRASENRLEEALASLGSPQGCAKSFREEMKIQDAISGGGPWKTIGTLLGFAATRSIAFGGLLVTGLLLALSMGFLGTAICEFIIPDQTGLWVSQDNMDFAFGVVSSVDTSRTEVLGAFFAPVSFFLSVLTFVVSQWIGKFFLQHMSRKQKAATA